MPAAYSADIRGRVIARVESGSSRREAADQFEVSPSSAIRWVSSYRATGSCAAKPRGGRTSVWRFFKRHDITFKKSLRAAEQERADVARARRRWMRERGLFDPARLVFIDETSTNTAMVRLRGRCPRGVRLIDHVPHGHWKTITFVAGL